MSSKEDLKKALIKSGWHLTQESIDEFLAETPNLNTLTLCKKALDCDLRNIGLKHLPEEVSTGKSEIFDANSVLQLVRLRNIAAPKENENSHSAPPIYKITLTDGTLNCNCIVIEDVQNLNLNTPPGTKIHLTGTIRIKSNLLILLSKNVKVLGGNVDYLVTKWKLTKDLSNHIRVMCLTDTAPPPWVPFGTQQKVHVDTTKKVFEQTKVSESEESSEFTEARKAILAEAMEAKAKLTKTFAQQNIDKTQIVQETKSSILTSQTNTQPISNKPTEKQNIKRGKKGKFRDIDNEADYSDAKNTARPPAASTLFDLFKTKLDINDDEQPQPQPQSVVEEDSRGYGGRGGRGSRGRGGRNQGRNQRFQQQPQQNTDANKNKQVYNLNDFNFELGEEIKLETIKQQESILSNIKKENANQNIKKEDNKPQLSQPINKTEFRVNFSNPNNNSQDNNQKPLYDDKPNQNYKMNSNKQTNYRNNNNNNNYNNYNNSGNSSNSSRSNNYSNQQNFPQQADQAMAPLPFQRGTQEYYNRNYNQQDNYYNQYQQNQQYYQQNNQQYNKSGNYYQNNNNNFNNFRNNDFEGQNRTPRGNFNNNNNNNNNRNWDNSNRRQY